ncbi:glycosyltransferase [Microbacterium jiangjiandongii]|uniref:glycosyltransferase n=1 Tax=Microbacterium jiangjiandongii TaxID=3049071 RepID=UPI00214BCEFA|nr:glycosyltransferase [Microbacterium sp. zg.Y843]MCR2815847.1 glycosyltransferase [Microbacterium sp. zg.Y843]
MSDPPDGGATDPPDGHVGDPPDGGVIDRSPHGAHGAHGPHGTPHASAVRRRQRWHAHQGDPVAATPTGAVIIPARDEAAVIGRALRALAPLGALDGVEVIVACNGCRDDTAEIARGFPGVRVVELDAASKTEALNLADSVATAWPRLYVDADVELDPQAALAVFAELRRPGVLAARPPHVYDVSGASAPVRAYYRARARIPGERRRLWGAGAYGTNERGHARFDRFAAVTADDSWFDGHFSYDEKRVVDASATVVHTPRTVAALLGLLARQRRGYVDLRIASGASGRSRALASSVRDARTALDAAWYVALTLASRLRRPPATADPSALPWERDASSRVSGAGR